MNQDRPRAGLSRRVVYWAAAECTKQRSGEMSVAWMLDGWAYAIQKMRCDPTYIDVLELGRAVEPNVNHNGTRTGDVQVAGHKKLSPALIERNLKMLLSAWRELSPDEWYREYEDIHPFLDGNGRTGNILWNWRRGTLPTPSPPPDLWADQVVTDITALKRMRRT